MTSSSAQGSLSPSSSPRLPSPPPFPEVQIGPKSPSPGAAGGPAVEDVDKTTLDSAVTRRIRPGTKAADMSGPPLVPLAELDSPFQLQEHLKALYLHATRSEHNNATVPITRETASMLAAPPDNVERSLWLYELCRFLVQKANSLIVGFFSDNPPCSAKNCPEMRASEWQYLCAVHDPPKSCCAIDYCCHTLDWAANVLTSPKHFPSRLTLGGDVPGGSHASVRHLTNIFRRVYRMFAHAWFQHRDVFWSLENQEGLYIFYKTVCDIYQLIPDENYTVPPEAEGLESQHDEASGGGASETQESQFSDPTTGMKPRPARQDSSSMTPQLAEGPSQTTMSTGATTRRHKHTPSTGSFVTTIAEGDEEAAGDPKEAEQQPLDTASTPSTVRRDPSSSPPKKAVPTVTMEEPLAAEISGEGENVQINATDPDATATLSEKVNTVELDDGPQEAGLGTEKVENANTTETAEPELEKAEGA